MRLLPTSDFINKHLDAFNASIKLTHRCSIGKRYSKCINGKPCKPELGSFVTECAVKGCNNFGGA